MRNERFWNKIFYDENITHNNMINRLLFGMKKSHDLGVIKYSYKDNM